MNRDFVDLSQSEVLVSIPYTIETGFPECQPYVPRHSVGGIGSANRFEKYHDYEDDDYPRLSDFLDTLTFVDGKYPSYCSSSVDDMNYYFVSYMREFASDPLDYTLRFVISQMMAQHYDAFGATPQEYQHNIVIGTPYYNFIFYKIAWLVALDRIPLELIDECVGKLDLGSLSQEKRFVNEFDHIFRARFVFDVADGCFDVSHLPNYQDERIEGPVFHCSEGDYRKYWKPYIMFLSNFSLILAANLATNIFGQCAFTLGWEHSQYSIDLPREEWPHPARG